MRRGRADLAAVYNVPLGSAVFVLEVLLGTFGWTASVQAIVTSAVAALAAQVGLHSSDNSGETLPKFLFRDQRVLPYTPL